jgi:hypothetical protein
LARVNPEVLVNVPEVKFKAEETFNTLFKVAEPPDRFNSKVPTVLPPPEKFNVPNAPPELPPIIKVEAELPASPPEVALKVPSRLRV